MTLLLQPWQVNFSCVSAQSLCPKTVPSYQNPLGSTGEARVQHMGWQSARAGQEVQGRQWCFAELCRATALLLSRILMLYFTFQHPKN